MLTALLLPSPQPSKQEAHCVPVSASHSHRSTHPREGVVGAPGLADAQGASEVRAGWGAERFTRGV